MLRLRYWLSLPLVLCCAALVAQPASGEEDGLEPPLNSYLADSPWPMSHRNPYNQASSPLPGPSAGDALVLDRRRALPTAITLAYSDTYADGRQAIWASSFFSVYKVVRDGADLDKVGEQLLLPDLSGGLLDAISSAYTVLDTDGTFFAARQRKVFSFADKVPGDAGSPIDEVGEIVFKTDVLPAGDTITAMNITYDGTLILVSEGGVIIALDRDLEVRALTALPEGEEISNSVAIDEEGGIYIVASEKMHRAQWTDSSLSLDPADGAWSAPYDGGDATAPGRLGAGSGTTPTLMGTGTDEDELVVIGDGQELMHIVLFWRDEIPAGWTPIAPGKDPRIAAEIPVTFGRETTRSETEQSIAVRGYDAMIVSNTYGFPFDRPGPLSALTVFFSNLPGVKPHGVEKFSWDPAANTLASAWSNPDVSCPNGIPTMSAETGLGYCYGAREGGRWSLEALDWDTGTSAFHHLLGGNRLDKNSFYAATQVGLDGEIVSGVASGMVRIRPEP